MLWCAFRDLNAHLLDKVQPRGQDLAVVMFDRLMIKFCIGDLEGCISRLTVEGGGGEAGNET